VPARTPDEPCAICGEAFRKRYDEAEEAWMYVGAAVGEDEQGAGGLRPLHHVACASALLEPPQAALSGRLSPRTASPPGPEIEDNGT
jgi:hypothetical protein